MVANRAVTFAVVAALSSSGCLTAMERWRRTRDPQAVGMALVYGNTLLAFGGAKATVEAGGGQHFTAWWLGIYVADMMLFVSTQLGSLKR